MFWLVAGFAHSQNRGVYPLGLSAINSGVSAAPGLTYNNSFLFYARDEQKGGDGVDSETEAVHPDSPVHVAEASEADDEHARHD